MDARAIPGVRERNGTWNTEHGMADGMEASMLLKFES